MAFTVSDFRDLVELLEQKPQWRQELRRLVLTDDLLDLPRLVAQLVEAQKRAEERLQGAEERLDRVEEQIAQLVEAQKRTEDAVAELAVSQRRMGEDLGLLKGFAIENSFRTRPSAWYSPILRRPHVLSDEELIELVEPAVERGLLSDEELHDLSLADAVVAGRLKRDGQQVYLVVEVSWGVGESDLQRAVRRAQYLARIGVRAQPALGGRWIIPEVKSKAASVPDIHLIEWKGELAERYG